MVTNSNTRIKNLVLLMEGHQQTISTLKEVPDKAIQF